MPNNLILNYHDACIYESDLNLLLKNEWLNDACINYGMTRLSTCLEDKCTNGHGHDSPLIMKFLDPSVISYFMFQLTPHDPDDIEEFSGLCLSWGFAEASETSIPTILLLPINDHHSQQGVSYKSGCYNGYHWSLMMVVKIQNRVYYLHFDSSPGYNCLAAEAVSRRITYMILQNGCGSMQLDQPILECKVPKQMNGYDCGIHVLITAEILLEEFTSKTFSHSLFHDPTRLNEYCGSHVSAFMSRQHSLCQMGKAKRQNFYSSISC
mmetsp:Transcript_14761/g.27765  ORF Transcript_14761/g.27765 Transcript_14761/m.27765 type:complete len:266 (+) Transcript_14761:4137-4934(+)